MSVVVLGLQVTSGVPKNNNASDHGNTNRLVSALVSQKHIILFENAHVRNTKGV